MSMTDNPLLIFTSKRLFESYKKWGLFKTVFIFSLVAFISVTFLIVPMNMIMGGSILTGMVINMIVCSTFMPYHLYQVLKLMVELDGVRNDMYDRSIRDELTKVYNRRYFFEVAKALENKNTLIPAGTSILLIDIDDFKVLNDAHGHHAGDMALKTLTEKFSAMLRSSDVFARYGGDEFICLLPQASREQAHEIAKRISNTRLAVKLEENQIELPLQISIGSATSEYEMNLDELIALADQALYKSKHLGKNRIESL